MIIMVGVRQHAKTLFVVRARTICVDHHQCIFPQVVSLYVANHCANLCIKEVHHCMHTLAIWICNEIELV